MGCAVREPGPAASRRSRSSSSLELGWRCVLDMLKKRRDNSFLSIKCVQTKINKYISDLHIIDTHWHSIYAWYFVLGCERGLQVWRQQREGCRAHAGGCIHHLQLP